MRRNQHSFPIQSHFMFIISLGYGMRPQGANQYMIHSLVFPSDIFFSLTLDFREKYPSSIRHKINKKYYHKLYVVYFVFYAYIPRFVWHRKSHLGYRIFGSKCNKLSKFPANACDRSTSLFNIRIYTFCCLNSGD